MLLALKFYGRVELGNALGRLLAGHPDLTAGQIDAVIPVPLHNNRLEKRGYNQAQEIARPVAERLGVPMETRLLTRIRATPPQTGSSFAERKNNMRGSFASSPLAASGRFLLVDDTLTTGATLIAVTSALLVAGAAGVSVAVVSRTPRYGSTLP